MTWSGCRGRHQRVPLPLQPPLRRAGGAVAALRELPVSPFPVPVVLFSPQPGFVLRESSVFLSLFNKLDRSALPCPVRAAGAGDRGCCAPSWEHRGAGARRAAPGGVLGHRRRWAPTAQARPLFFFFFFSQAPRAAPGRRARRCAWGPQARGGQPRGVLRRRRERDGRRHVGPGGGGGLRPAAAGGEPRPEPQPQPGEGRGAAPGLPGARSGGAGGDTRVSGGKGGAAEGPGGVWRPGRGVGGVVGGVGGGYGVYGPRERLIKINTD